MSYIAPVKDMLFNMAHLGGLEQIAQMPAFEDAKADGKDCSTHPLSVVKVYPKPLARRAAKF